MAGKTSITVQLPAGIAAGLAEIAERSGLDAPALLASIAVMWIGERRITAQASRMQTTALTSADRLSILQGWRRVRKRRPHDVRAATTEYLSSLWLDRGIKVSLNTLYGWEKRWAGGGMDALADRRGDGPPTKPGPFLLEVARLFQSTDARKVSLASCYRDACETAKRRKWEITSYKTAQRFIGPRQTRRPKSGAKRD